VPRKRQTKVVPARRGTMTTEVPVVRVEVLLLLGLSACSSRLELGHDLPGAPQPALAPSERTPATCDGGPCFAGPVVEIASSMGNAQSLVLDRDNVYWAAPAARMLMLTPRDGSPTVGIEAPAGGPYRLVADAHSVYFSGNDGGYVAAFYKDTGSVVLLVSEQRSPQSIAVTGSGIYFSDPAEGTIKRSLFDVTAPDEVSSGSALETIATGISAGGDLAVDDDWLYYSDSGRGEINAIALATGQPRQLTQGRAHPGALLARGGFLYFLELGTPEAGYGDGRLLRVPRTGGDVQVLVEELDAPTGLAADTASVYVSTRGNDANGFRGRIVRRADSGEVSTLATDQAEAISIAVDDRAVFWTVDTEHGLHSLER